MYAALALILLQVTTGGNTVLESLLQTGGMVAVLAFFLIYFMKEQKELRSQMAALTTKYETELKEVRRQGDDKVDALTRRVDDLANKTVTALNDQAKSNDRLTKAVDSLTEKLIDR